MTQDISRNVVAILLVLTMAVAGAGTWAVLNAQPSTQLPGAQAGEVSLDIERAPPVAQVSLQIASPEEQQS